EGMLFEELGFRYFGPVDGHDLHGLVKILRDLKGQKGPLLLHVFTEKGHGVPQASQDPVTFHTPPVFTKVGPERTNIETKKGGSKAYTDAMSAAIADALAADPAVAVLTAAMCQGNKLERVRDAFPDRFFDVGICESHAVAFAAGMAKAGMRPIVDVYSTFLQRAFDQVFQEVALQNLPVVVTIEEGTLEGGFGSAVLEAANAAGLDTRGIVRAGVPDRFIEHGERGELLEGLGLDVAGLCSAVRKALGRDEPAGRFRAAAV